jgi:gamma-glutamylcyclotransferase (GGCT)/AIG2-like uncharacterized protein YtfP
MDIKQLNNRCPSAKKVTNVFVDNYEFQYDGLSKENWPGSSVGNIVSKKNSVVWGVVYSISLQDSTRLDAYEHVGGNYQPYHRIELLAKDLNGKTYNTYTYCRKALNVSSPAKTYKEILVNAAKSNNLPNNYINEYLKG